MTPRARHWLIGGAAALGVLLLGSAGLVGWYASDLPPLDKVTNYRPRQHLQVLSAEGVEIAQFGSERRLFVPIAQTPKLLVDAVLAVEDANFRDHAGISWRGLARAVVANLDGGTPQGGSTITQQVARTFFLSTRRTAERKIKEALLAVQIERHLTKDQILELYLNQIYLGQRAYGFGAAAQVYFGKRLDQLSVAEVAMLAGLPQNPGYANPITNLERAKRRQLIVLQRMRETGVVDEPARARAAEQALVIRTPGPAEVQAGHVAELARQAVVQRLGEKAYTEGVRVHTAIRVADQAVAHAALRRAVLAHEARQPWRGPEAFESLPRDEAEAERAAAQALKEHGDDEDLRAAVVLAASPKSVTVQLAGGERVEVTGSGLRLAQPGLRAGAKRELAVTRGAIVRVQAQTRGKRTEWSIVQWPQAEAAFVALDPASGRVRALVGGFDFARAPFNRATQAWRQPGSAFKPFLYSAAFEAGVMPDTIVDDEPWVSRDGNWQPRNSDGRFDGPLTVREALAKSKNMVSVRLVDRIGIAAARNWTGRFGFEVGRQPDNLTLALGAGATTPLQLAAAYGVLANGGQRVAPVIIERIVDADGRVLFAAPAPAPERAVPERNVFLVNQLLADVTRVGTAARAQAVLGRPDLYGKTGTTNDAVDAWFAGWAPGVVAVAWMGHDEPRSLGEGESGGGLALPMWIDYMAQALKGVPVKPVAPPEGVAMGLLDWRYSEWVEQAPIEEIEAPPPPPAPWFVNPAPAPAAPPGPAPAHTPSRWPPDR
jgi:penicillin-binding protein 1A